MKCFHHDDLDGKCAAYWVKKYAEKQRKSIECISINYNLPFPLSSVGIDEEVWIVDFSISPELMMDLLAQTKNVIWVDHHKTAIDKYDNFKLPIEGWRVDGISGCELTYMYTLFKSGGGKSVNHFPEDHLREHGFFNIPYFTQLIGDRDIWKFAHGDDTRNFYLGISSLDTNPESDVWKNLDSQVMYNDHTTYLRHIINQGIVIDIYKNQWAKDYREAWGFEVEFEGYKCYAMNLGRCGSEYFGEKFQEYDIVIPFILDKFDKWNFSLYSTKVDVSEIAKKYGGGGHRGASGFSTTKLPFKLNG